MLFLMKNVFIVSNIPGTTRDAIDIHFTYNKEKFTIIDTAELEGLGKFQKLLKNTVLSVL